MTICFFFLSISWLLIPPQSFAGSTYSRTSLPPVVSKALADQGLPADSLSVFVQQVSNSRPLLSFGASTPRNPASTIKLLTTFVALDELGPAYTWKTEVYISGQIHQGRLDGDLIVKGHGDPFLVTEYLWKLLRGLRDRGLHHIAGDLIVDNSYFESQGKDATVFDGQLYRTYNAMPDALLVNFQTIHFNFIPQTESNSVRIIATPRPANLQIKNGLRLTRGPCRGRKYRMGIRVSHLDSGVQVGFSGRYPISCGSHIWNRVVLKPTDMFYGVFKTLWNDMGGALDGRLRVGSRPEKARLLYTHESRPLAELIRGMNKFSNNVMTRQLLLTLGAEQIDAPGTEPKGIQTIMNWLKAHDLVFSGLVIDNGAGLSRISRISALSLGRFLLTTFASPYMPEFVSSMPLAGMDGTMKSRFRDGSLAGRLHAKTGSLKDVSALAGFLLSRRGRSYVVVIIQNHPDLNRLEGQAIQDTLLRWVFEQ
ncbi:MAG: D-alanyl-D-alanine carboxypeptidase/D-alanyl-D-alanine-endopeptidase [Gammaproteobacteria bacterium]|nr:D-alanyl-D-alanine carboxypeptidase/D-alanyl-D-alanine-endopeptidase [Gammaproteobacteria bacterium]